MSKTDKFICVCIVAIFVVAYFYSGWAGVFKILGGAVAVFIGLVVNDYRRFHKQKEADELKTRGG